MMRLFFNELEGQKSGHNLLEILWDHDESPAGTRTEKPPVAPNQTTVTITLTKLPINEERANDRVHWDFIDLRPHVVVENTSGILKQRYVVTTRVLLHMNFQLLVVNVMVCIN